ncbi:MAG: hypothetical protein K8R64_02725 [Methanosarcinaceae archaeon]|nr:hypothetical protein [Methanosarcinaceae archaeon]
MTVYAMYGDRKRFLNAGCVDHIVKSIDLAEFWRSVIWQVLHLQNELVVDSS